MLLIFWDLVTIPLILGGVDDDTLDFLYWASFVTLANLVKQESNQLNLLRHAEAIGGQHHKCLDGGSPRHNSHY